MRLGWQSQIHWADFNTGSEQVEVVFPGQIHNAHPAFSTAIQNAAQNIFGWNVSLRLSYDESAVKLRRMSMPMEIFRLRGLPDWERSYASRLQIPGNGLRICRPNL